MAVDEDNASRIAAFLAGKYDLGWEFPGTINRTDWVQIKDTLKQKRPNLKTVEFPSAVMNHISMRTDAKPFSDVRVRQAMSLADRKSTRLNSSHSQISYAVFCLKKKKKNNRIGGRACERTTF